MDDTKKDLYVFIALLIGLAILWRFTGGPERGDYKNGPYLYKPEEKYAQQLTRQVENISQNTQNTPVPATTTPINPTVSPFKDFVRLGYVYGRYDKEPEKEYIEIQSSYDNKSPIKITGWKLVGKRGLDVTIGRGAYLVYSAQINPQQDIYLYPGDRAYIITGISPIGTSFKINKCIGYFSQFQNFYPELPSWGCPRPEDEEDAQSLDDNCLDYLETIPRCRMQISIPPKLSSACQSYINEKINYNTCVEGHKNDSDFYKGEWRIYLGRTEKLWKEERETIILKDENGKIVDSVSY